LTSTRTSATKLTTTIAFPDRDVSSVSPQVSMLYHFSNEFSFYTNLSKSFRAPTLNELYRSFRVGNVLTQSNEKSASRAGNNFEAGVSFSQNTHI